MNCVKSIVALLAVLFCLSCIPVHAQMKDERLTVRVAMAKTVVGADRLRTFNNYVIFEGDGQITDCAVIETIISSPDAQFDLTQFI